MGAWVQLIDLDIASSAVAICDPERAEAVAVGAAPRMLESAWTTEGDALSLSEHAAGLIGRLAQAARRQRQGDTEARSVLIHPAACSESLVSQLLSVAASAGLAQPEALSRPIAEAAAVAPARARTGELVVMAHLAEAGAEVSLLRRSDRSFELAGAAQTVFTAVSADQLLALLERACAEAGAERPAAIYVTGSRTPDTEAIGALLGIATEIAADPENAAIAGAARLLGEDAGARPAPPAMRSLEAAAPPEEQEQDVTDEDVQFTVYRPHSVRPGQWYTLLAYAHKSEPFEDEQLGLVDPLEQVQRQAARVLGEEASRYGTSSDDSAQELPRGAVLSFVPGAPGVEFNPPSRSFKWLEPVHQEEFRMCAARELDGRRVRGRVSVFFGAILIAEVSLSFRVSSEDVAPALEREQSRPYRKIFVSYSHADAAVVERVELALSFLGDDFLRDARTLRVGEVWEERLEQMIDEADIFQLFWSRNSMTSSFVRQEWTYALSLSRANFVRPVSWEDPWPALPSELSRLHVHDLKKLLHTGTSTSVSQPGAPARTETPLASPSPMPGAAPPPSAAAPPPRPPGARPPAARRGGLAGRLAHAQGLAVVLVALVFAVPLASVALLSGGGGSAATPAGGPPSGTPGQPSGGSGGQPTPGAGGGGGGATTPARTPTRTTSGGAGAGDAAAIAIGIAEFVVLAVAARLFWRRRIARRT